MMMSSARALTTERTRNAAGLPIVPNVRRRAAPTGARGNQAHLRRLQAKLTVGAIDDPLEREADAAADRVMRMGDSSPAVSTAPPQLSRKCATCEEEEKEEHPLRRKAASAGPAAGGLAGEAPPIVNDVLSSPGRPLDPATHDFMASRFGTDFGEVRIHTDGQAARSAAAVGARAYTVGRNIVFGEGQYDPVREGGRRLIAHELSHVLQQGADTVRRATLTILPANVSAQPGANERKAAASCDVGCSGTSIGTLHIMPLFYHSARGAPLGSSAGSNGIGAEMHFIRNGVARRDGDSCPACRDHKLIQIVHSNATLDPRGDAIVDNQGGGKWEGGRWNQDAHLATPYYEDHAKPGHSASGAHTIPADYSDAGNQISTTKSIYDRPFRSDKQIEPLQPHTFVNLGEDFLWNAETCVTCIQPNGKDKVLGKCVTYGFTRKWDPFAGSHDPAIGFAPACNGGPSAEFVRTLAADSSLPGYTFET